MEHHILSSNAFDMLFRNARTHSAWREGESITDHTLRQLYDLFKWGPTSANSSPARFVFIRTPEGKERLRASLAPGNVEKTMVAPVTVIVAYDLHFYEKLPKLFPHKPSMYDLFANNPQLAEETARRNSSLQGAYMMIGARALGLDCGPMSGFDNAKVDKEFFDGTHVRSNFLCNLGYGDDAKLPARLPRLDFDEAATLL